MTKICRPDGFFGWELDRRLSVRKLTTKSLAEMTGCHKEFIRKLIRGSGVPSRDLVARLCRNLRWGRKDAERRLQIDWISRKYGLVALRFFGIDADAAPFQMIWPSLTTEQQRLFTAQMKAIARMNRREKRTAKRKRRAA
jgi:hypothetical protein